MPRSAWVLSALLVAGVGAPAARGEPGPGTAETIAGASVAAEIEKAAAEAVRARVRPPDRIEVVLSRSDGGSFPASEPLRLEILDVVGPNTSGSARVRLRVLAGDRPVGEARATVRCEVRGPALVARRTLARGAPIPADAVEVADCNLTRMTEPPLREPGQVRGLAPVRTLGTGQVLAASLVGGAPVVHRGQPVSLKIETERMSVIASGTARRDGAVGETVTAENAATGAVVTGSVQPDGSILVVRGNPSRGKRS
ncbi:MAG: flagellar basal body P-ring formation chaperone FlgA [Acidobacteriia bacterium]|nr:flagellar basal body P-ring formation chaperone FlgA [Terriglobia bacterium]